MKRAQEEWKRHSLWPQKVTGSLEFSDLLYDPNCHGDKKNFKNWKKKKNLKQKIKTKIKKKLKKKKI